MDYLENEVKMSIKGMAEKYCYSINDNEKFDLLKGSFELSVMQKIKNKIEGTNLYYLEKNGEFKEAKYYYIGKSIVIVDAEGKSIIEIISLLDHASGLKEFFEFAENFNGKYEENYGMEEEQKIRLDELVNEFMALKKNRKIEKGKILEEISNILVANKELGTRDAMWKALKINSDNKSKLCKRYNLFNEFKSNGMFSNEEECREIIENMTDEKLKEITREGLSFHEKEKKILELV